MSRETSSRWSAWFPPWVHPGWMTQAKSYAARPIPQPVAFPRPAPFPDCVPLNLFGGAGSITEEQLAYVIPRALINRGTNEQRLAQFVLSGPGGRMLGRALQWVLGADYRREAGNLTVDPLNGFGDRWGACVCAGVSVYAGGEWGLRRT